MKKLLTTFVIILLMGFTVFPSIQANASYEIVEVISELWGKEGSRQSIKLTLEETEEVKELFNTMIERIDSTGSMDELTDIITNTLLKLNKFNIFVDLDVESLSNFIINYYRLLEITKTNNINSEFINYLCLFIGHTEDITLDLNVPFCLGECIAQIATIVEYFSFLLGRLIWFVCSMFILYGILKPLRFMNYISCHETSFFSIGLLGIKKGKDVYLDNILGYSGIKITFIYQNAFLPPDEESYFLGTAIAFK